MAQGAVVNFESVHGNTVLSDEVAVAVTSIYSFREEWTHPKYGYEILEGGFTAWDASNCEAF